MHSASDTGRLVIVCKRCFWCVSATACNGEESLAGILAAPLCLEPEEAVPNGRDCGLLYHLAPVQLTLLFQEISLPGKTTKRDLPPH